MVEKREDISSKLNEKSIEKVDSDKNKINSIKFDNIEKNKNNSIFKIDENEIILGFNEVKENTEKLYQNVFNLFKEFKPTINDVLADVLAFISGFAIVNKYENTFEKVFKINVKVFGGKYLDCKSVPLIFKLCDWANKNKNYDCTLNVLNGLIRSLMGFNIENSNIVYQFLNSSVEFLNMNGVNFN